MPWLSRSRDHIWRFWMAKPSDAEPWLMFDMGKPITFSRINLHEKFNRIDAYRVETWQEGQWMELFRGETLGMLSYRLPNPVTAQKVRLMIEQWTSDVSHEGPGIRQFDLY